MVIKFYIRFVLKTPTSYHVIYQLVTANHINARNNYIQYRSMAYTPVYETIVVFNSPILSHYHQKIHMQSNSEYCI